MTRARPVLNIVKEARRDNHAEFVSERAVREYNDPKSCVLKK